jgi:hypothetical protein
MNYDNNKSEEIKGENLIIFHPLREGDLELVRTWRNQDEIRNNMYTNHIISPEEHLAWYQKISKGPGVRYWIFSADGMEKIGLVHLYDIDLKNRRAFWGIYLGNLSSQGKGIGSRVEFAVLDYVFFALNLNKLNCEVLAFNKSAINFYKKFGFKEEGDFKQHIFRDGRFYDVVRLTMLKQEWTSQHRQRMKEVIGITEEQIARKRVYVWER